MVSQPPHAPLPGSQSIWIRFLAANPGQPFTPREIQPHVGGLTVDAARKTLDGWTVAGWLMREPVGLMRSTGPAGGYRYTFRAELAGRALPHTFRTPEEAARQAVPKARARARCWAPGLSRAEENRARERRIAWEIGRNIHAAMEARAGEVLTIRQIQQDLEARGVTYGEGTIRASLTASCELGQVVRVLERGQSPRYRLPCCPLPVVARAPLTNDARKMAAHLRGRPADSLTFMGRHLFGGDRLRAVQAAAQLKVRGWISTRFVGELALFELAASAPAVLPSRAQDRAACLALAAVA